MKFRKKPVVIEATQWFKFGDHPAVYIGGLSDRPRIDTLEGPMFVSEGDWIITGIAGEQYPCKPEIFEATYERVEMENREMSFGEKAVGLTFNPSGDPTVEAIKRKCADLIDEIHELRTNQPNAEIARMASIAITEIQSGQMWAVKAATWRY